ncbi:MAG TPA: hypothetical protein VFA97_02260 [Gaiellaceae bacterium]|nr:hypothetical protein [Gaiellaceae bacterium]
MLGSRAGRGALALLVLCAFAVGIWVGAAPGATPGFFVGFDDDLAKQVGSQATGPMRQLGARAVRVTLQWSPGETALTSGDAAGLDRAVGAASGLRVLLTVYGTSGAAAPVTATERSQYCSYVSSALARESAIRDVIVWNEPNKNQFWSPQIASGSTPAAPAAYEALLATCYDTLHKAFPSVDVLGFALAHTGSDNASSTSPGAFIRGVGTAYRASGRGARILDTVAYHPYPLTSSEPPGQQHIGSTTIGEGDWNKLMYNLWQAFNGTAQPIPGQSDVTIWYSEWGVQSAIPAAKASLYTGTENVPVVSEADQAAQVTNAIDLAACQPYVHAFFNFLIADEPSLTGWQSAPLYVDRTPKSSYGAFASAISAATQGSVNCSALPGGTPSSDYLPPSTPASLTGSVAGSPPVVTLRWQPATDNASPVSYRVYRGSALVATTTATTWSATVAAHTTATYTVRAIDSAGNLGNASNAVTVSS